MIMVITVLLLGNLWRVWRKRENERDQLAALSQRDLQDIGLTDADRRAALEATVWRTLLASYRRRAAELHARRARTQRAVTRLSRMEAARDDDYPWASTA
jgi:uncharacterized protein YjiS (DUF1127 family)